jgi:hypothetical protein
MTKNSRQHPREEIPLRVDYVDAQGHAGLGLAKNLSYTGVYLTVVSRPLHVGDTLTMTFARVVHANKAGVGLRFINADAAYRQLSGNLY